MKLLITGAGGFLGSRLAAFYAQKYDVWAPARRELDLTDGPAAAAALAAHRPQVVVHCAAVSDVAACAAAPARSLAVNVRGTQNLARACAAVGAKLVFCSSDQVYFCAADDRAQTAAGRAAFLRPHREAEPLAPLPVYGQHKLLAEGHCLAACPASVVLRLSWMYGPLTAAERAAGRQNLLTRLEAAAAGGEPLALSTTDYRGVTDVAEVARHLEAAWALPGGVYNFGSPCGASLYETVRAALASSGRAHLVRPQPGGTLRNLGMDPAKTRAAGIVFPTTEESLAALRF